MKRRATALPAVGVSSLLTIFAVLCLVTFTLLSISTAQTQKSLSQAAADSVLAYYEADAQAEAILTDLRRGQLPPDVTQQGDLYTYACPISHSQRLEVAVRVSGGQYTVLQWQAVPIPQTERPDDLGLWPGEEQP